MLRLFSLYITLILVQFYSEVPICLLKCLTYSNADNYQSQHLKNRWRSNGLPWMMRGCIKAHHSPMVNRCCIMPFSHYQFQRQSEVFVHTSEMYSRLLQYLLAVFTKRQAFFFFYKGASKQTFSMRSRCVVTWLSGWLSVWLACDIDWQWQVKRFQRVFCCWATCWSRTHMGTELTLPEEPTGLWRDAARVSIIYCDTLQHWTP